MTLIITGYAAVFNTRDLRGDHIDPGAFRKTLRCRPELAMLLEHNPVQRCGRWLDISTDDHGLRVVGQVDCSSTCESILLGKRRGLSIGFQTVDDIDMDCGDRIITRANLWEASIVASPMMPSAVIQDIVQLECENV